MNSSIPGGCPECGATVGHRMIRGEDLAEPSGSWSTQGRHMCSLGQGSIAREEYERVLREKDEAVRLACERRDKLNAKQDPQVTYSAKLKRRLSGMASTLSSVVWERDAYLTQLTAVQARCTELLEENRALRQANGWRAGLRNGPQSALDILGIDRDRWKARAISAERAATPPALESDELDEDATDAQDDGPPSSGWCGAV